MSERDLIEKKIKVLENQVRFLRNWIYDIAYPLAPMSAMSALDGFDEIKKSA